VAEREIVLDRIVGIEPAQRRGDVDGHPPSGTRVARQPEAAADADHVSIERDDQLRRRHARPDAEIERVAAHHPPEKQVEPLAARSGRRTRKEVADTRPLRHAPVRGLQIELQCSRREAVERARDVLARRLVPLEKESFD